MQNINMQTEHSDFAQVSFPLLKSIKYQFAGVDRDVSILQIQQLIEQLSEEESREFWEEASQIYQCGVDQVKETYQTLRRHDEKRTSMLFVSQQVPNSVTKTQKVLRNTLITVLKQFRQSVPESIADNELCVVVNEFVENDIQQRFWNRVASMIPSKTKKQIYDFYRNNFSRALYATVTKEEQRVIAQINAEFPNEKPSALAQVFLERTQKNILKRDIVMRFVNIRRNKQQPETNSFQ
ncbi:SANT/Myb_domain [Hexamita inflata]|uniref:SANT/Myb_domain n=1 Tax=Hexamita inflata TaxID=28002 RepID=A0ABP1HEM4_9EUKA